MLKMAQYVTTPVAVYIDPSNTIHLISPVRKSLYQVLHIEKFEYSTHDKLVILI